MSKNTPLEEITQDEQFSLVNPEGPAVLTVLDTMNTYLGHFGSKQVYVRLNHSSEDKLEGVYYVIDSVNLYLKPVTFCVTTEGNAYKWDAGDKDFYFETKYQTNKKRINGAFIQIEKHPRRAVSGIVYFDFQKYEKETVNKKVGSNRYQKKMFEVDCERDVVYGHALGPWTSLAIADDEGYAKAVLPYLFKASANKNLALTMDVYTPRGDSLKQRPLVVLIHGGAFFFGDKHDKEMVAQCTHFASLGYVAVSINYRMGFELSKSSIQRCGYKAIQDAHAAMRYLTHHAEEYGIDKERMYIGGSSAGSITAMSMVYMTDETRPKSAMKKHFAGKFGALKESGNDLKDKVKIKGIINMWGAVYEMEDVRANPLPTISFHGTADQVVPFSKGYPFSQLNGKKGKGQLSSMYFDEMYGSQEISEVLKAKGVHQEFYPLDSVGHAPWKDKENRRLNEVFYFIQNKVTKFLYDDLVYDVRLQKCGPTSYCVSSAEVKQAQWTLHGGVILETSSDQVDIRLLKDVSKHTLSVTGVLNNDAEFRISKFVN
ncbi:MAG: alpha/beta hydrolase [Bacteroidales bacterium]|nr:alpha/beta hydrolase [Bacteroidales bacterium]